MILKGLSNLCKLPHRTSQLQQGVEKPFGPRLPSRAVSSAQTPLHQPHEGPEIFSQSWTERFLLFISTDHLAIVQFYQFLQLSIRDIRADFKECFCCIPHSASKYCKTSKNLEKKISWSPLLFTGRFEVSLVAADWNRAYLKTEKKLSIRILFIQIQMLMTPDLSS